MCAAVRVADAVELFDDQRQEGEQPVQQDTVGFRVVDVFQAVAVPGVVDPLVLDLPAVLGHVVEREAVRFPGGEIGQPVRMVHCAVGLVLPVAEDAYRFRVEGFPGIEVIGPSSSGSCGRQCPTPADERQMRTVTSGA